MLEALRKLLQYRALLYATSVQALRARFTGSVLGGIWFLVYPILFLSLYTVIFIFIFKLQTPGISKKDYILIIFSGLVPFLAFSEAFSIGTNSILANRSLLRNTIFPIELIIARDVVISHATMGLGMLLVWGSVLYFGYFSWAHLAVPLIYLLQILMTLGLVWITASCAVFFRDFQHITPILIMLLMLISPIAYSESMIPDGFRQLLTLNPIAWFLRLYRDILFTGMIDIYNFLLIAFFSIACFVLGFCFILRVKPLFTDYI